ncbi:MAG: cytochrome P450, partial [Pirellulales bacterium]
MLRPQVDCTPACVTLGKLRDFPRDAIECMRQLHRKHGLIAALEEEGQRLIFAFGPDYNQRLLSDPIRFHSRFSAIRGPRNSAQRRLTCGLLSMNGEEHKRHRRLVMGPFQKKSIDVYCESLVGLSEALVCDWRVGQVRDVFQDMTQFMLRVTSSVLFGFDVPELAYNIGRMTERWIAMNHEVGIGAFVSDQQATAGYGRLLAQADALEAEIVKMIEHRRSGPPAGDVLSLLIRTHDETGAGMTDAELIGQAAVLFGAAHLTTANTLTWTLFLLAQHPEIAADLYDELTGTLAGGTPSFEQLDRLPLLDRVIKESMRVLPASSYSQRTAAEPVELGPFRLGGGTPIVFSQFITHHMPELFPDAERFRPERWETISPSPYAYLPFAAGPRMCIGAALAVMTLKIALSAVLQRYSLSMVAGSSITGKVTSTMLGPTQGMPMLVEPATARRHWEPVVGNIHRLVTIDPAPD